MSKFFSLVLGMTILSTLSAQTGRISGTILDAKTGETLPGATIFIEGTTKGASADFDGKFSINNVPVGKVTLIINYVSYTSKKIGGVDVKENDATDVNVLLDPSTSTDLQEVEVVVTLNKENNVALVLQQKNNISVSDGISTETIKRTPDRNTSDVLKRVSGASIQDNKFVIVRGTNERYNASYLNGAPLPSTESDRKAFSFDIFPANMLDNIVITKTARPDMPGEFAGGIIDINTKSIPEKNFVSVIMGGGYNTLATGKDRLYYNGEKRDLFGKQGGANSIPEEMPTYTAFPQNINDQAALAKQVPVSDWGVYDGKKFFPNGVLQLSGGYNFKRKEKDFFGILGSVTYQNTKVYTETERINYQSGEPNNPNDPLIRDKSFLDKSYMDQVLAGVLLNMSVKLNENNSISSKNLYSFFSDDRTIHREGVIAPDNDDNPTKQQAFALWYTQNNIATTQLIGDHYLPKSKIRINWNANYANVVRSIPNLRRHNYSRLSHMENKAAEGEPPIYDPNDTIYKAELSSSNSTSTEYGGNFLWSDLHEYIYNAKTDVSRLFKINPEVTIEPKVGAYFQKRAREFDFRQFIYSKHGISGGNTTFDESITYLPTNEIFVQEHMGVITPSTGTNPNNIGGFKIVETTQSQSEYTAGSELFATYAMVDVRLTKFWRIATGVRYESYRQTLSYRDPLYQVNHKVISQDTTVNDFLPSLNLIYSPNDKVNIRGSYAKTLNRPEFRELAPFLFYDFNTQFSLNGDPQLKRAVIDNYDLRFEWFPGSGQLASVSGFYKRFENPIELFQSQNASQIEYKNVPSAFVQGIEFEYRLNIGNFYANDSNRMGKILNNITLFSNLALIKSEVDNSGLQGSTYKRPMQGQSPYLLNAGVSYIDLQNNFSFSVMYNLIGPRLYIVGNNLFQEIWELPRHVMDFQVSKSFFKNKFEIRLNARDIFAAGQPLRHVANYDDKRVTNKSTNTAPFWNQKMGSTYSLVLSYKF